MTFNDPVSLSILYDVAGKLFLAVLLSGMLGFERERRGRPAGLRTHVLVCLGSTMLMVVSDYLARDWNVSGPPVWLDRGRIAAGIITGIGFLGAGTIVHGGRGQQGLTTAAMIWFVAALGVSIGAGYQMLAVLATGMALGVVVGFGLLERVFTGRDHLSVRLELPDKGVDIVGVEREIREAMGARVAVSGVRINQRTAHMELTFQVYSRAPGALQKMIEVLRENHPDAHSVTIQR